MPFYGGSPIAVYGPPQPGYERHLGFGLFTFGQLPWARAALPDLPALVGAAPLCSIAAPLASPPAAFCPILQVATIAPAH